MGYIRTELLACLLADTVAEKEAEKLGDKVNIVKANVHV